MEAATLSSARYGKDQVRICKVLRDKETGVQTVVEMTIRAMIEGGIDIAYTEGDNSVVVATDSIKNTCYILAKQNPVHPPELFASIIGSHFIEKYAHIHSTQVEITVHRWSRMTVAGKPHPHSFIRDGTETRNVVARVVEGKGIDVTSSIEGLLLLKSTGSQFWGYIKDEYTTLPETWDRILSTEVDASWTWNHFASLDDVKAEASKFDGAWTTAREITLTTFAEDESPSVQGTTYTMGSKILAAVPEIDSVDYSLPNKHFFEIDLSYHNGIQNKGKDAEVYAPQWGPNGLIKCTVTRPSKTAK